jgi:hypothetical protein
VNKEVEREGKMQSFWNTKETITRPLTIDMMLYNIVFYPVQNPLSVK